MSKIKIAYIFNHGRIMRNNVAPKEFFYGSKELSKKYDVEIMEPDPISLGLKSSRGNIFPMNKIIKKYYSKSKTTNWHRRLFQTIPSIKHLNSKDAIVTVNNQWIHGLNFLRRLGVLKTPIIGISIGPYKSKKERSIIIGSIEKILYDKTHLIFLSDSDIKTFKKKVLNNKLLHKIYFCVDTSFWKPSKIKKNYVFSIGNAYRDYDTLIKAWKDRNEKLIIVSKTLNKNKKYGKNIQVHHGMWNEDSFTDEEIRKFYQESKYVIIPIIDSTGPMGQSTILQSMACGKATITSDTKGLFDKKRLVHKKNCYLVKPGSIEDMKKAIEYFENNPDEVEKIGRNAKKTIDHHFSSDIFAKEIEKIVLKAKYENKN